MELHIRHEHSTPVQTTSTDPSPMRLLTGRPATQALPLQTRLIYSSLHSHLCTSLHLICAALRGHSRMRPSEVEDNLGLGTHSRSRSCERCRMGSNMGGGLVRRPRAGNWVVLQHGRASSPLSFGSGVVGEQRYGSRLQPGAPAPKIPTLVDTQTSVPELKSPGLQCPVSSHRASTARIWPRA